MSELIPTLLVPASPRSTTSYSVAMELNSVLDPLKKIRLLEETKIFAEVGDQGGYADPGVSPSESHLTWAPAPSESAAGLSFRLEAKSIDIRAFQVLRSMLYRLGNEGIEVNRVTVTDLGQSDTPFTTVPEPNDDNEMDVYPGLSSSIDLEVVSEEADWSKMRRWLAEMRVPPDTQHVLALARWVAPWYDLLEAGAFALPPSRTVDAQCIRGTVTLFDEVTVEITVDRFMASESGSDVLINLLDGFGKSVFPISNVILD